MKIYRKYHRLPPNGPTGITLFGIAFKQFSMVGFKWYKHLAKYDDKIVSYQNLNKIMIVINDPEIAKPFYNDPAALNRYEPYLSKVSNTITFLNGPKWKLRRKNIHTNLLTTIDSQAVIQGSTQFLKNVMFPHLNTKYANSGNKIDTLLSDLWRPLTFNLVLFATTGRHIKSLDDPFWIKYNENAYKFWSVWRRRIICAYFFGDKNERFGKKLTPKSENIRADMVRLVKQFISENGCSAGSFYSKMKELETLTDDEILSDISSLLFPSIDTTSNVLAFCIMLLCKYPKIQEKVFNEVINVFGNDINNINLSPKYLSLLIYFRSFIHETLRLYPPSVVTALRFFKDWNDLDRKYIEIDVNDNKYYIGKGDIFLINNMAVSRNVAYWIHEYNDKYRNNKFDMERVNFEFWVDNQGKFRRNKSLSTFSFGPRECVGKQVAIKNLYVVLSGLIMTYKFSTDNDFEIKTTENPLLMPMPVPINICKR